MISADQEKQEMISVHALGKFEFCHRAGLIAHESDAPDREESRTPRLDHLPDLEIARITEARKAVTDQLIRMGLFLGVVATGIALASQYIPGQLLMLILLAIALPVRYSYLLARDYWELTQRIWRHNDAAPTELEIPVNEIQKVNWWGLLKNESYASAEPRAPYIDHEIGLAGSPARILSHGGCRIPVIAYSEKLEKPKRYHLIRLGAYAHLIENSESTGTIEYGIILNLRDMTGIAVPIGARERDLALRRLQQFREMLEGVEEGVEPVEPEGDHCQGCPFGAPRLHHRGLYDTLLGGNQRNVFSYAGRNQKRYHSTCGDRFRWIPPHARAIQQEMV